MGVNEAKTAILENRTALGIEFGSTRIKAVLGLVEMVGIKRK